MIDDAGWLVIADRLTEAGNPLGEFIMLTMKHQGVAAPDGARRRLRKLAREWKAKFASKLVGWHRTAVSLTFAELEGLFASAEALRPLGVPLSLEVDRGRYDTSLRCYFDHDFTRLATVRRDMSITNINHSPGMDEDKSYSSEVTVWRVADRAQLSAHSCEGWVGIEFRADGLYALEGGRAQLLR